MKACVAFGPGWKRCVDVKRWLVLVLAMISNGSCRRTEVVSPFPDSYVGVGMELRIDGDTPVVVRTLAGGSAREAGVERGDRILEIDGTPTRDESLGDIVMRIRGKPETQVTLAIQRGGDRILVVVRRRKMAKKKGKDYGAAEK
jgi:C-terminal processing protease CtpA/Prc